MRIWITALALVWMALLPSAAQIPEAVSDRPPAADLTPAKTPTEVKAGLYYIDISDIDGAAETYTATAYFVLQWNDPRLRFTSKDENKVVTYRPEMIWMPAAEIVNAEKADDQIPPVCFVTADGTVYYERRVVVRLNNQMDLRRFPFDRQNLEFIVESSSRYGSSDLVFQSDPDQSGLSKDIVSRGWSYAPLTCKVIDQPFASTSQNYSRVIFTVCASRNCSYFIWKIIFPTAVFVLLTWTIFWMPVSEVQTALVVSITVLLTAVAFGNVTDALLPKIGYRTWLDQFQLGSFLFIVATVVETITVFSIHNRGDSKRAEKVRTYLRIGYPAAYALFCVVLVIIALV